VLGGGVGDGLGGAIELSSPMHWAEGAHESDDPALPEGIEALARHVKAPVQLERRLSQIGVVDRGAGIRLAGALQTGQRLVSREGDLWRGGGVLAAAAAPNGAAARRSARRPGVEIRSEL